MDFGFATKYLDKKGMHLPSKELESYRGNMLTASLNHMEFKSTGRRDDMISLLYLVIYLLNKGLPWEIAEDDCRKMDMPTKYLHVHNIKLDY